LSLLNKPWIFRKGPAGSLQTASGEVNMVKNKDLFLEFPKWALVNVFVVAKQSFFGCGVA